MRNFQQFLDAGRAQNPHFLTDTDMRIAANVAWGEAMKEAKELVASLKSELAKERECVDYYANHRAWQTKEPINDGVFRCYSIIEDSDLAPQEKAERPFFCPTQVGGNLARQRQSEREDFA